MMRPPLIVIAAFVAKSLAFDISQLPQCGLTCYNDNFRYSSCSSTDFSCICDSKRNSAMLLNAWNCIMKNCSPSDYVTTEQVFSNGCGCPVGVIYTCTFGLSTSPATTATTTMATIISSGKKTTTLPSATGDGNPQIPLSGSAAGASSATLGISQPTPSTITSQSGGDGLTTGAKAGLGVGITFGVIIAALLLLILLKRSEIWPFNSDPKKKDGMPGANADRPHSPPAIVGAVVGNKLEVSEVDGRAVRQPPPPIDQKLHTVSEGPSSGDHAAEKPQVAELPPSRPPITHVQQLQGNPLVEAQGDYPRAGYPPWANEMGGNPIHEMDGQAAQRQAGVR